MNLFPLVLEEAAQAQQQPGGIKGILTMLIPFILIIAVMYFVSIRPQKKREKKLREQLNAMRPGDRVMSIGGIVGRVANISDDEVTIYTGVANTMLTFKKSAISTVMPAQSAPEEEA